MSLLKPGVTPPDLRVPTLDHGSFDVKTTPIRKFLLLLFYRGYHCSICMEYIHDLSTKLGQFQKLGVDVICISTDRRERAEMSRDEWHAPQVTLGYDLPIDTARAWGLYLSNKVQPHEPEIFNEPAQLVIAPDHTLYSVQVQSNPFGRPNLNQLLNDFEYILDHNYPPRGRA